MKYYIDDQNNYLGGWDENPPAGAIEVPTPPLHANAIWHGNGWTEPVQHVTEITKLQFIEWCEANNKINDLLTLLNSDATLMFKWNAATSLAVDNSLVLGAAASLGLDAQAVFDEIGGQ